MGLGSDTKNSRRGAEQRGTGGGGGNLNLVVGTVTCHHTALCHRVIYFYSVFFSLSLATLSSSGTSVTEMQRAALTKNGHQLLIYLWMRLPPSERVRESAPRLFALGFASSSAVLTSRAAPLLVRRVQTVGWLTTIPSV